MTPNSTSGLLLFFGLGDVNLLLIELGGVEGIHMVTYKYTFVRLLFCIYAEYR